MTAKRHVIVVGGGVAGLAAALRCADGGAQVSLFESRPRFGGATWSFERNGLSFDNGQHVYLRCCTAYREFLERLGTADKAPLRRLAIPVLAPAPGGDGPTVSWIRRSGLPAPLHLARSLATYRHLPMRDRVKIANAAFALRRLALDDASLDAKTFATFLSEHGQSGRAIAVLWDLIALPTINVRAAEASLALAAKVFKTGLLARADAADIGWSDVPLAELHVDPAVAALRHAGAAVHARSKVAAIEQSLDRNSVAGVVVDGERIDADAVIVAAPHDQAADLLPAGANVDFVALRGLGYSPIIDVHLVYDRRITDFEIAAAVDSPIQFLFDRSRAAGLESGAGQCLAVSVSGADEEHGLRPEVLIDRYATALVDLFPRAAEAKVVDAVVTREHRATFRGVPGTASMRPDVETGYTNLFLAGAYTATGWPATMEGAVRSGLLAAARALEIRDHDVSVNTPMRQAVS